MPSKIRRKRIYNKARRARRRIENQPKRSGGPAAAAGGIDLQSPGALKRGGC
jgi:hypothetical protein